MEKNKNKILKYFSGMMNENEEELFLVELKENSQLKKQFDKLKSEMSVLKNSNDSVQLQDNYFNSILPKVHAKMEDRRKRKLLPRLVYSLTPVAAVLILFLIILPSKTSIDFSLENYTSYFDSLELKTEIEDVNNFYNEELVAQVEEQNLETLNNSIEQGIINVIGESVEKSEIEFKYLNESYEYLETLEEAEFNKIYNELSKTKIL